MKSTAAVMFYQICALYVLIGCSPASTAPFITGAMQATIKPYYSEYNKIMEILDEKIGENVSATTSDTTPVIGIINDDNTAIRDGYSRSKQKDFKYDQFQSLLEALTSASSKFKAMSMTTEQPFGEELTTNSFNDLVITEMLQTKHPKTAHKTKWLYPRAKLAITLLNTSYIDINSTTTMSPTPTTMPPTTTTMSPMIMTTMSPMTTIMPMMSTTAFSTTVIPNFTTTVKPTTPLTTTIPTTPYTTTTQMPITTTTQRPKPNKFTCTLCVIIIVNE